MAVGFTGGAFNSYWNAWIVGEVRRANSVKMQYLTMVIPSTLIMLCAIGTIGFAVSGVGRDFLIAMNQILTNNPSFFPNVPTSFIAGSTTMIFVPMMLADNTTVQFILMIGIAAGCLIWPMASWLMISRDCFAWAFDRLLPAKFADVSDRFHTPVFNLVVNFVIMEAFAVFLTYIPQYFGFAIAAEWAFAELPIMVYMIAIIVLPLRKEIWAASPASKYKIGPIPIAVIGGIIGALFMADNVWFLSTTPAVGFGLQPAEIVFGVYLVPFILYWVIRAIRRKQGIDIDLIFKSIPPE
jgi:amino acid transporter